MPIPRSAATDARDGVYKDNQYLEMRGRKKQCSRLLRSIDKRIPRMKDAQIIDVLNIALLEIKPQIVFLSEEMYSIESFSLGFGYRWD